MSQSEMARARIEHHNRELAKLRKEDKPRAGPTPGPWEVSKRATRGKGEVPYGWINLNAIGHLGGMKIETHFSMPDAELDADLALIAAAPCLLDALDRIATGEFANSVSSAEQVSALRGLARAAIAKATATPAQGGGVA